MDQRRRLSIRWIVAALIPVALVTWRIIVLQTPSRLQVGPETTRVTGPLTPDGRVDFAAALHLQLSSGVTPDNNAAVLLDQAFGPGAISPELRSQYFVRLGIKPLPEQGSYVVTQSAVLQQKMKQADPGSQPDLNKALLDEFRRAQSQPWNSADCPVAAEWLQANAGPLELIEQAARRPHYYSPLVTNESLLQGESAVQNLREAVRLLATRAMFRLGEDDAAGAWSDLLACHRLSQLASQGAGSTVALLVAFALDSMATAGDAALVAHGLTVPQARTFLAEHASVPPLRSMADVIDRSERLNSLDAIMVQMTQAKLDINTLLRAANRMFDDIVAAMKLNSFAARAKAMAAIDADFKTRTARAMHPLRIAANVVLNSRRAIAETVGDVMLGLLLPANMQTDIAQTRSQVRRDLVQVGFALAACRAELGAYPASLEALVPLYLNALPVDQFTERPLIYVPRDNGFLLYSVGANSQDDGGRYDSAAKQDDIAFEVPPKFEE